MNCTVDTLARGGKGKGEYVNLLNWFAIVRQAQPLRNDIKAVNKK
jgi:hypothetical protein